MGNIHDIKLTDLTANDWAYVEADLSSLGKDANYKFDGISIQQNQNPLSKSGAVYLDNVTLDDANSTGMADVDSSIFNINYDATEGIISVNEEDVKTMRLYSMNGSLVAYSNLNRLNVEAIKPGIYIVEVKLNSGNNVSQKVVIN